MTHDLFLAVNQVQCSCTWDITGIPSCAQTQQQAVFNTISTGLSSNALSTYTSVYRCTVAPTLLHIVLHCCTRTNESLPNVSQVLYKFCLWQLQSRLLEGTFNNSLSFTNTNYNIECSLETRNPAGHGRQRGKHDRHCVECGSSIVQN